MNLLAPKAMIIRTGEAPRDTAVLVSRTLAVQTKRSARAALRFVVEGSLLTALLVALLYVAWQQGALQGNELRADTSAPQAQQGLEAATLPATIAAEPTASRVPSVAAAMVAPASRKAASRLMIGKIGVDMPIVEGQDEQALYRGAWRSPFSSTPDQGGNMVIFGHRYLRLPPHPQTFYSLDKLAVGDTFDVVWKGTTYRYRVVETKVVAPEEVSVLGPTDKPSVTLITCTPIFTTKNRLVVRGELIAS